jgi:gliding motility-associated-like protein
MNKLITPITIICCANITTINAQNLVPNPSFEDYTSCPVSASDIGYSSSYTSFPTVKKWVRASGATPDYFNACATDTPSVPANFVGHQYARTGNGYAGVIMYMNGLDYSEYIEAKLTDSLKAGQTYAVSFFVCLADKSRYATDKIAVHFSNSIYYNSTIGHITLSEDVCSKAVNYLNDTTNWIQITGEYVAKGGEKWILMGKFADTGATRITTVHTASGSIPFAYLYIDDVSVINLHKMDTTLCSSTFPCTIHASHAAGRHLWSTGDTSSSIAVSSIGKYWCADSLSGTTYIDTFRVRQSKSSGIDTIICVSRFPDTLYGSPASGKYVWNTGDSSTALKITGTGIYWRTTIDSPCVDFTDTFKVRLYKTKGRDTTICTATFPFVIYAGSVSGKFTWSNGDSSANSTASVPGTYWRRTIDYPCVDYADTFRIKILKTRGIDTTFCFAHFPDTLAGSPAPGKYKWNTGDTGAFLKISAAGIYWRKTIDSPCVSYTDTFKVGILKNKGMDTTICIATFPAVLYGSMATGRYTWSNGDSTFTARVYGTGVYWRHTADNFCTDYTDTIRVKLLKTSGIDTSLCLSSFPYTIAAPALSGRYIWNTGSTLAYIIVSTPGVYWRKTIDSPCVNYTDTFKIGLSKTTGFDSLICSNTSPIVLTDSLYTGKYTWSTGATTASISTSVNGIYMRKTVSGLCINLVDTFNLHFFNGTGMDTIYCNPSYPLKLKCGPGHAKRYLWVTGDSTYSISIMHKGLYWRKTMDYCTNYTDTIFVNETPKPFIGNDSTYCFRYHVILSPDRNYKYYSWSTGETTKSIQAYNSGTYILSGTDNCGTKSDTVNINILNTQPPLVSDTTLCRTDSAITLLAAGQNLLWYTDTNGTASQYQPAINTSVTGSQTLYVTQTINSCESYAAPLNIKVLSKPVFNLGNDTTICDKAILAIGVPGSDASSLWNTGDTTNYIFPKKDGLYVLNQTNYCGTASDSIDIHIFPCDCLWAPNAFSPNGDGKNDYFHIIQRCPLRVFTIHVYNRFGQLIFRSGRIDESWDGNYLGVPAEVGDYYYYINYAPDIPGQEERIIKGEVTLIR